MGVTPPETSSEATDVSADGSVIIGNFWTGVFGVPDVEITPFYWDERHGARTLESVLLAAGADVSGWTLREALAVSVDGRTIVGWGINPGGQAEAFRAVIPEPATWILIVAAVLSVSFSTQSGIRARRAILSALAELHRGRPN